MTRRYTGGLLSATEQITDANTSNGIFTLQEASALTTAGNFPTGRWTPQRSLRFRASASAYLNRTFGTPTNNKVWTWSAWVKRGSLSLADANHLFMGSLEDVGGNPSSYARLVFETDGTLRLQSNASASEAFTSSALFRDPSAWYHIVLYMDAVNTTVRCYVNGAEIIYAAKTNPTNANTAINRASYFHRIGLFRSAEPRPFDGYMADVNFIDGQALDPSYFGATDPETGTWVPKRYAGTYGANGFYLDFRDNTSLNNIALDKSLLSTELITNGNFNADVSGWTVGPGVGGTPSITLVSGAARIANSSNNGVIYYTSIPTTIGNTYYVRGYVSNISIGGSSRLCKIQWSNATNSGFNDVGSVAQSSGSGLISGTFVATATTTYIHLNADIIGTGTQGADWDNISVSELGYKNHWNTNNISLTSGTTYDSMVDVPGIASVSSQPDVGGVQRGNYATWNPLSPPVQTTLSQGNLFSTATGSSTNVITTFPTPTTGKWYAEITMNFTQNINWPIVMGVTNGIGGNTYLNLYTDWSARAINKSVNGVTSSVTPSGAFPANGDILKIAYDADAGKLWLGLNSTWYGASGSLTGTPENGGDPTLSGVAGKEMYPNHNSAGGPAQNAYLNCGQRPFTYTPPTGFKSINTTNFPNPVIKRPSEHFDIKTWTGNGVAQMIGTNQKQVASAPINKSLKFKNSSELFYLERTPTVSGNRRTWTYSTWVKQGDQAGIGRHFGMSPQLGGDGANESQMNWQSDGTIRVYDSGGVSGYFNVSTVAKFTETNFWYHIVVAVDTTQINTNERTKIYVNGVKQPLTITTQSNLNQNTGWNHTYRHRIGLPGYSNNGRTQGWDGYLAEINHIDGQALTPTSFGQFDANNNWVPKTYTGTYGTNGFYLPLSTPTTLETLNYGASFNGVSQGLTTTATGLNASTGTWTVEGWAYSGSQTANEAIITGQVSGTDYFYWNYTGTTLYFGDGATNTISGSNAKPENRWFHWAIVKNGSTYTLYIDGVSIGSTTTALRSGVLTQWQIGIRTSQSYYWSGAISNVRVNTTTAVYTGNFTPQTTPLTTTQSAGTTNINAISSGTQLLTCNSATLVDSSSNAYAITNTGSVPVVSVAPWHRTVGYDASGNNNKFTPLKSFNFLPNPSVQPNVLYYGTPGTYTWTAPAGVTSVNYLVVGGGGGGGDGVPTRTTGAGGGAGGMLTGTLSVTPLTSYTVTVGAGGNPGTSPTNGGNSVFSSITSLGGGYGAYGGQNGAQGGTGGSGGGTSGPFGGGTTAGGLGTAGQGNNGGVASQYSMSGGGGAGGPGLTVNGGNGLISSITGTAIYYAGGSGVVPGLGGGGRQADNPTSGFAAIPGVDGLGGGGGGGSNPTTAAARGGSGVVILSYTNAASYVGNGAGSSFNNNDSVDAPVDTTDSNGDVVSNYCVLDSNTKGSYVTLTNGGLTTIGNTAANSGLAMGTLAVSSGKWYWEMVCVIAAGISYMGVAKRNIAWITLDNAEAFGTNGYAMLTRNNGDLFGTEKVAASTTSFTNGDILACALDMDSGALYISKNGTWLNSGNPVSGLSKTGALFTWGPGSPGNEVLTPVGGGYSGNLNHFNFGQSKFVYTPPTGFKAINTKNLKDAGSYNLPDNYGNFVNTPDLVWLKATSSASYGHRLTDTVRGPTRQLLSHDTAAQYTDGGGLRTFLPNGFQIGAGGDYNTSLIRYVAWAWNRGKIPGFDIVNYSGNGGVQIVSHNLGVAPSWLVVKKLSTATNSNWMVYHSSLGPTKALNFNTTSTAGTTYWNSTSPTSNTFTLDSNANYNASNDSYIAYLWAEVPGFSKFGAYTNNNSTDGVFIYTGFRPKFVLIKNHDNSEEWYILDSVRQTYNQAPPMSTSFLKPNSASASSGSSSSGIDLLSNGFKIRTTNPASGEIGFGTRGYIYCAFAETPFKYANAR